MMAPNNTKMILGLIAVAVSALLGQKAEAFAPSSAPAGRSNHAFQLATETTTATFLPRTLTVALEASAGGKKKRRRKQPPGVSTSDPVKTSLEQIEGLDGEDEDLTDEQVFQIDGVANFEFQTDSDITMGIQDDEVAQKDTGGGAIPLPDIKDTRRRKEMEEEIARMAEEKEETKDRNRIKRTDKEAMRKLLEQQPFADSDASYFEEEKYGTVSALLAEGAAPFLGLPSGPLQIGHFTGALGIVLMAFIEYPGFPLTNLPTPIRDALQGGLGTVYAINAVLAVFAVFKARERGQPIPLWVAKTFGVGGLAYDQLTQLPTLEEIERVKAVKGARAQKRK